MNRTADAERMRWWAHGFGASMFGVAGLAQFVRPGGWALWPALALLVAALLCWTRVTRLMRQIERGDDA